MKDIEFYKEQYLLEHERSNFYDTIIQYPTTLIVIFIGGVLYSFNKYFPCGIPDHLNTLDWIFVILFILFGIITILTIYSLYIVFHGFTRKYYYLPRTISMAEHEKEMFKYHYKYSEKTSKKERIIDAKDNTCDSISNSLRTYYIDLTDANQIINNKRAEKYGQTRTFLFIDLILLIVIAVISFLK